jgi:hypothetical protein
VELHLQRKPPSSVKIRAFSWGLVLSRGIHEWGDRMMRPVGHLFAGRGFRIGRVSGGVVLRISVEENPGALALIVEGRLVGPWVDELQRLCQERGAPGKGVQTTVDLCGLTAMDTRGQALLDELLHRGATLRCSDVMNQYLVEQMARPAESFQEAYRPCQSSDPR